MQAFQILRHYILNCIGTQTFCGKPYMWYECFVFCAVGVSPLNKHLITSAILYTSIIFKPSMVLFYHCQWHQFGPQSFTPHKISLRLRLLVSNLSSSSSLWRESESTADGEGIFLGNVSSQRPLIYLNTCSDHRWIRSSNWEHWKWARINFYPDNGENN